MVNNITAVKLKIVSRVASIKLLTDPLVKGTLMKLEMYEQ